MFAQADLGIQEYSSSRLSQQAQKAQNRFEYITVLLSRHNTRVKRRPGSSQNWRPCRRGSSNQARDMALLPGYGRCWAIRDLGIECLISQDRKKRPHASTWSVARVIQRQNPPFRPTTSEARRSDVQTPQGTWGCFYASFEPNGTVPCGPIHIRDAGPGGACGHGGGGREGRADLGGC